MEKFDNKLDPEKFRSTNSTWNKLRLNAPWSIGYVTTIIEAKQFSNKEEWENFYYESGKERNREIQKLSSDMESILNNPMLSKNNPKRIENISWKYKSLNLNKGRTKDQIAERGQILYKNMKASGKNISREECTECVRFRTICETWNGVVIRERNTIKTLEGKFKNVNFKKTEGEKDHKYAVDYEIYANEQLVCGIQIKPISYRHRRLKIPYLKRAHSANVRKHRAYEQDYGNKAIYVYSRSTGAIANQKEVFPVISKNIAAI